MVDSEYAVVVGACRVGLGSKAAKTGPWLLRTGFRLIGRPHQLRFYRQTCRRIRRLTEAELETHRVAEAA